MHEKVLLEPLIFRYKPFNSKGVRTISVYKNKASTSIMASVGSIYWSEADITKAKDDFRVFLFMVWRSIGLPSPTPIQYAIADYLQNPPSDRIILEGFRGVAKSFITCAFADWCLWRDPQTKVEIVSASKDRADANAVFIKRILTVMPFLNHLLPDTRKGNRDTMNLFDVAPAIPDISPSVKSVGINGQITGTRADLLIGDDVEVPKNSGTQLQRDKLSEAVKEFDSIIKPQGQIVYLGTPQCEMSLYNELQKRGYKCMVFPVLYPTEKERNDYNGTLAPYISEALDKNPELEGQPTDPLRFNEDEIFKRRLSYGKAGFMLQFMLNTNLSDAEKYPLKVQDFIVCDLDMAETSLKWGWATGSEQRIVDIPCTALRGDYFYSPMYRSPETAPYTGTVVAVDPAGRGSDQLAYAVVKFLNGYQFLMEIGGVKGGYSTETLTMLANKCKFWNANYVVAESNFGDGMWGALFKPILYKIHPCTFEEIKNNTQKEARIIDTLEPVMMRHKLVVNTSVIRNDYQQYAEDPHYSFIYQLTRLTRERGALAHDDKLDAFAMAVAYWRAKMGRDADTGLEEYNADLIEKWMDEDWGVLHKEYNPNLVPLKYRKRQQQFPNMSLLDKILS